jgi:hypothetical protein
MEFITILLPNFTIGTYSFNFGENYPNEYNNLASKLAKDGTLGVSQCPNGLLGIGALGL